MIGVQVGKPDLNMKVGDVALSLNSYFNQAQEIKEFLDVHGKPGLVQLGFTEAESDIMISAFNDLMTAKDSFDASAFIKQLYGMGIK